MKLDPLHYPESTLKTILEKLSPEKRRIAALLYGSGARISEANQITKEDIKEEENYMKISCKVLKKRKVEEQNQKRVALIRLDELWLIEPIRELIALGMPGVPLINQNRVTLYYWMKRSTGINPHMFRAIRATHLAQKGYTAHQLKHFFGWSSVSPSDHYVRLNTKDLEY